MKNGAKIFLLCCLLISFTWLQNCKPNENNTLVNTDPDSLYVGTPYTLQRPSIRFPEITMPSNINMTEEGIQLGRMLFYDPILSSDSTISCAGCHKQQYAFADGGNALSTNVFHNHTRRNAPPLFNLVWMRYYFWDGRAALLTDQVADALHNEQNFVEPDVATKLKAKPAYVALFKKAFGRPGDINQTNIENAIAQFMLTLISADSKFDKVMRSQEQFTASEYRGFYNLFLKDTIDHGGDCFHCHASNSGSYYTMLDNDFHNNALDASPDFASFPDLGLGGFSGNMLENGKFKTPHLRNIEVTGPYMRDGRYTTLQQVVNFYNDSLKQSPTVDANIKTASRGGLHYLTQQDKDDMVAFMKTLTDTAFLNNPAYSNPFH